MKTLQITDERVLAAANKCGTAKEVLKELFPEVFQEDKSIQITDSSYFVSTYGEKLLKTRTEYENKFTSFWLNDYFNWEIKKDSSHSLCLIPTKK